MRVKLNKDGSVSAKRGAEIYAGATNSKKIYLSWVDDADPTQSSTSNIPLSKLVVMANITRYDDQESGWQLMKKEPSSMEYSYLLQEFDTKVEGPATISFMWYNSEEPDITYSAEECGFIIKKGKIVQVTSMDKDSINALNILVAKLMSSAFLKFDTNRVESEDVTFAVDGIKLDNSIFYNYIHEVKNFNWSNNNYDSVIKEGTLFVFTNKKQLENTTKYEQQEFLFAEETIYSRKLVIYKSGTDTEPVVEVEEVTDFYNLLDVDKAVYNACLEYIYNRVPIVATDKVVLPVSNWENNQLTLTVEESPELLKLTSEMTLNVVPSDNSAEEYYNSEIDFTHSDGVITFTCVTPPVNDLEITYSTIIMNANFALYAKQQAFLEFKAEIESLHSNFTKNVTEIIDDAKKVLLETKILETDETSCEIKANTRYFIDATNVSNLQINNVNEEGADAKYYNLQIKTGSNNLTLVFNGFGNLILTDGTNKYENEITLAGGTTAEIALEYDECSYPLAFVCSFDTPAEQ